MAELIVLLLVGLVMVIAIASGFFALMLLIVGVLTYLGYQIGGPCGGVCGALLGLAIIGGKRR